MSKPRVLVVSSCDALSDIAGAGLFSADVPFEVVGLVRTSWPLKAKLRLLRSAVAQGGAYYAVYVNAEGLLAAWNGALGRSGLGGCCALWSQAKLTDQARRRAVPTLATQNVNDPATVAFMRGLSPDFVLSLRPGHIFRRVFIGEAPTILNVHCTMLPAYRGIAGVMRTLADGGAQPGCTVHVIDGEGVDSGPIVVQIPMPVEKGRSVFHHTARLFSLAPEAIAEAIDGLASGRIAPRPQADAHSHSWPGWDVLRRLHGRGGRLLGLRDLWCGAVGPEEPS